MTAPALERCPRCRYALINGVCPIHEGRQVADRLPMMAPLPKAPDTKPTRAKVFVLKRRGAA